MNFACLYFFHADNALAEFAVVFDQLLNSRFLLADNNAVSKQHRKGLVADKRLGFEYGMTQSLHLLLADKVDVRQFGNALYKIEELGLSAFLKNLLQLGRAVKMVFNQAFAAVGDNQNIGDACMNSFLYDVLNSRLVHNREHFFRKALGGGQHSGAKACCGNDRLAYFHSVCPPIS